MTDHVEIAWRQRRVQIEYAWINRTASDRPLLVFLHEGLGSVAMWRDFAQRLCDALGCSGLVYSRPGYGRSTPRDPAEPFEIDFLHAQAHEVLPALLAALDISAPPWLFGHSDGGSIALLFAARFPTAGVVVMAPHIFVEDLSIASIEQARIAYLSGDLRQRLARFHDDPDSAFFGWNSTWLLPQFRDWNIESELGTITCPVLAIQGADDSYGTLAQIHGIAAKLPQTRLRILEGCGHSPQRDQPQALTEAVNQFFKSH